MRRHLSEPALRGVVASAEAQLLSILHPPADRRRRQAWARDPRHPAEAKAAVSSGTCTPPSSASSLESFSDAPRRRPRLPSTSDAPSCQQLTLSMQALRLKDQQQGLITSKRCSSSGVARRSSLMRAGGLSLGSPAHSSQRTKVAHEFDEFDVDCDNYLNKSEFMAWLRCELRWGSPSSADPLSLHRQVDFLQRQFEKADQQGNQRISLDEFAHYREKFQSTLQAVLLSGFSEGFKARSMGGEN